MQGKAKTSVDENGLVLIYSVKEKGFGQGLASDCWCCKVCDISVAGFFLVY